jgi:hypothetical protein
LNSGIHAFKARANLLETYWLSQRKIEIFGKAIITEVAALKRGSSLEEAGKCFFAESLNCSEPLVIPPARY